jgi:hypothetical protein
VVDYARSKASADRQLGGAGQAGFLRRPTSTGPAHDPTPGAPLNYPVTFAVFGYKNRDIDGTRILATDKRVLLAVGDLAVEPQISDMLVIKGVAHSIIDPIEIVAPAGIAVLYKLQVRR